MTFSDGPAPRVPLAHGRDPVLRRLAQEIIDTQRH
ncbi:DUF305 domain-containing protein [Herbidospora cretacea]|nr:DUF305 domain-containing protein [Herbidospora cretacea]